MHRGLNRTRGGMNVMFLQPMFLFLTEKLPELAPEMMGEALFWLGVIVLALIIEGMTTDMVSLWFAPGALVAMILAVFGVHVVIQIVVCVVISVALMILAKTVFKRYLNKHGEKVDTSVEAHTGRIAMVEEEINNFADTGVVKINGQLWSARMEDESQTAAKGVQVQVVRVQGTKLICKLLP